jgi:transcriptional regulator with XRE-family HTH domain
MAGRRTRLAERRKACGYTQEALAEVLGVAPTTIQHWERGTTAPQPAQRSRLARVLKVRPAEMTELLRGELHTDPAPPAVEPFSVRSDVAQMKSTLTALLSHGDRYGGDTVAGAAVQVWEVAQRKLDSGMIPEKDQSTYLSAASEAAEVAGWLLYDAGYREKARAAVLESRILAQHAGDQSMELFALDLLAMLDVESGRPGEALRIADEILSRSDVPPRVSLMAQVRRGRALAVTGDRTRALSAMNRAFGALEESMSPRDPAWSWWVDQREILGHSAQALLTLARPQEAIPRLQAAQEMAAARYSDGISRNLMGHRIALLRGFAMLESWREAAHEMEAIASASVDIASGHYRWRLHEALNTIERTHVPDWLADLSRDVRRRAAPFDPAKG